MAICYSHFKFNVLCFFKKVCDGELFCKVGVQLVVEGFCPSNLKSSSMLLISNTCKWIDVKNKVWCWPYMEEKIDDFVLLHYIFVYMRTKAKINSYQNDIIIDSDVTKPCQTAGIWRNPLNFNVISVNFCYIKYFRIY